ncbi:hypothetical protein ITJ43_06305 [Microbacterium sp. VKM Ac-2870]|uniref:protealysin inhibitor emfourin n=1 Tax=Microbacterium sp. VKM Ac-2870 TaxID=2783825 RepID=UPI00188B6FB0|nr:protealysin inhibitor emfourin [Microbacterium sp. VKM Ac-2870]MBF4561748.1 hypothetical protein [Microbacterium sp. VKM Ac-2870]
MRVTVARSGGIAGLTRRWCVTAPPREREMWIELVDSCPWEAVDALAAGVSAAPDGADRFTWTIEADLAGRSHRAVVAESRAHGPWRALIDAVRATDAGGGEGSRAH